MATTDRSVLSNNQLSFDICKEQIVYINYQEKLQNINVIDITIEQDIINLIFINNSTEVERIFSIIVLIDHKNKFYINFYDLKFMNIEFCVTEEFLKCELSLIINKVEYIETDISILSNFNEYKLSRLS